MKFISDIRSNIEEIIKIVIISNALASEYEIIEFRIDKILLIKIFFLKIKNLLIIFDLNYF
tara:strand:- start:1654 stop:1836 length:183 start_codon:yes stop_codon:yes gene_type:complete